MIIRGSRGENGGMRRGFGETEGREGESKAFNIVAFQVFISGLFWETFFFIFLTGLGFGIRGTEGPQQALFS